MDTFVSLEKYISHINEFIIEKDISVRRFISIYEKAVEERKRTKSGKWICFYQLTNRYIRLLDMKPDITMFMRFNDDGEIIEKPKHISPEQEDLMTHEEHDDQAAFECIYQESVDKLIFKNFEFNYQLNSEYFYYTDKKTNITIYWFDDMIFNDDDEQIVSLKELTNLGLELTRDVHEIIKYYDC